MPTSRLLEATEFSLCQFASVLSAGGGHTTSEAEVSIFPSINSGRYFLFVMDAATFVDLYCKNCVEMIIFHLLYIIMYLITFLVAVESPKDIYGLIIFLN